MIDGKRKWQIHSKSSYLFFPLSIIHKIFKKISIYNKLSTNLASLIKKNILKRKPIGYIEIDEKQSKLIEDHFKLSNQNLEKIINIDLKSFSYY